MGFVLKTLMYNFLGVTIRWVEIKFPIKGESEIIQSYEEAIEKYPNIKLAVIGLFFLNIIT